MTITRFGWDISPSIRFLTDTVRMSALKNFSGAWTCSDEKGTIRGASNLLLASTRHVDLPNRCSTDATNSSGWEFFELADEEPEPESVEIGLFAGLCNTHDTQDLRRNKWWLARDRTLIFATYNGPVRSADLRF
jgi:hypothetical protein